MDKQKFLVELANGDGRRLLDRSNDGSLTFLPTEEVRNPVLLYAEYPGSDGEPMKTATKPLDLPARAKGKIRSLALFVECLYRVANGRVESTDLKRDTVVAALLPLLPVCVSEELGRSGYSRSKICTPDNPFPLYCDSMLPEAGRYEFGSLLESDLDDIVLPAYDAWFIDLFKGTPLYDSMRVSNFILVERYMIRRNGFNSEIQLGVRNRLNQLKESIPSAELKRYIANFVGSMVCEFEFICELKNSDGRPLLEVSQSDGRLLFLPTEEIDNPVFILTERFPVCHGVGNIRVHPEKSIMWPSVEKSGVHSIALFLHCFCGALSKRVADGIPYEVAASSLLSILPVCVVDTLSKSQHETKNICAPLKSRAMLPSPGKYKWGPGCDYVGLPQPVYESFFIQLFRGSMLFESMKVAHFCLRERDAQERLDFKDLLMKDPNSAQQYVRLLRQRFECLKSNVELTKAIKNQLELFERTYISFLEFMISVCCTEVRVEF